MGLKNGFLMSSQVTGQVGQEKVDHAATGEDPGEWGVRGRGDRDPGQLPRELHHKYELHELHDLHLQFAEGEDPGEWLYVAL